jgi:hypothetical protein
MGGRPSDEPGGVDPLAYPVAVAPALALVPSLFDPLPHGYRPGVEIAGYFTSLALLRDGAVSYTYLTPAESSAGIHLHGLVSVVPLAAGLTPAGRLVSLIAAVAAAVCLARLVSAWFGRRAGLLAPALFWAHPLSLRLAVSWMPEALGIALTVGALAAAARWHRTDDTAALLVSGGLLVLGVWNHTWEASVALPVVVLALLARHHRAAVGVCLLTAAALVSTLWVRSLQPPGHDLVRSYSLFYHADRLLTREWLLRGGLDVWRPWEYSTAVVLPFALLVGVGLGVVAVRRRARPPIVLCAWLASGVAVPVLLPAGWIVHEYYAWALLAPLAAAVAPAVAAALDRLPAVRSVAGVEPARLAAVGLAVALVVAAGGYGATTQADHLDRDWVPAASGFDHGPDYPSREAGRALAAAGTRDPTMITFVGPWGRDREPRMIIRAPDAARVLIHGGVLVRAKHLDEPGTPRFVADRANATGCARRVVAVPERRTVVVEPCPAGPAAAAQR